MFLNFLFIYVNSLITLCTFIFQVWTIIDQRSMNTASVFFFTSSLPSLVITTFRSEWSRCFSSLCYFNWFCCIKYRQMYLFLSLYWSTNTKKLFPKISVTEACCLWWQVIASVLMLTREISDNKTLTIKSNYPTEYQTSSKRKIQHTYFSFEESQDLCRQNSDIWWENAV